jgi:hypothetical protein
MIEYTTREAATMTGKDASTIRKYAHDGKVGHKKGRDYCYSAKDIAWIKAQPARGKFSRGENTRQAIRDGNIKFRQSPKGKKVMKQGWEKRRAKAGKDAI